MGRLWDDRGGGRGGAGPPSVFNFKHREARGCHGRRNAPVGVWAARAAPHSRVAGPLGTGTWTQQVLASDRPEGRERAVWEQRRGGAGGASRAGVRVEKVASEGSFESPGTHQASAIGPPQPRMSGQMRT